MAISFASLLSTSSAGDGVCAKVETACSTITTATDRAVHMGNVLLITMSSCLSWQRIQGNKQARQTHCFSWHLAQGQSTFTRIFGMIGPRVSGLCISDRGT